MKKLLRMMLMMTLCYSFTLSAKADRVSTNFIKSEIPNSRTPRFAEHSSGNFEELAITIKDDMLIAVPYVEPFPFVSKLLVKEGIFEGIDIGEWRGIVKFSPENVVLYKSKPRPCSFCGSTEGSSCYSNKLQVVRENVFKGVFEGVDCLKYGGMGAYRFTPHDNVSSFCVVGENCRGLFTLENKSFAITGLAHMNQNYGNIYELVVTQDDCIANKICDTGSRPETFLVENDTAYIATETALFAFKDNQLNKLLDINERLYPSSMVYSDNCLFIGMRGGWMCKYDLNTKDVEWYRYTGESFRL